MFPTMRCCCSCCAASDNVVVAAATADDDVAVATVSAHEHLNSQANWQDRQTDGQTAKQVQIPWK